MRAQSSDQNHMAPIKIALLSAGLGRISRGFEISSATWFNALNGIDGLNPRLFSGGKNENATQVFNCPRSGKLANFLRIIRVVNDGCRLEQITFAFGLLPHLIFHRPDLIWLQEATLANVLLIFKRLFKLKYKIVFCDGAPVGYQSVRKFDNIIFLNTFAMTEALTQGLDEEKCCVIPHICLQVDGKVDKAAARKLLNLSQNKFVIICVAAWNKHHKRIDYLIDELAHLDSDDIVVLLCGQAESETIELKEAAAKVRVEVQWHTFSQEEISVAYTASDLFVLPSLNEALGAVLIEAGFHGLPVICHQHQAARFIFGEEYRGLADLSKTGNLWKKIEAFRQDGHSSDLNDQTLDLIQGKFRKDKLVGDFLAFVNKIQTPAC
jgi:1,2-diacylglycerol 3-alpha-glucosyltransferase